jgi:hypothetical protein
MTESRSELLDIFDITEKTKLVAHAKSAVVQSDDLANLILACSVGAIPFGHIPIFQHHHPEHLVLKDADTKALSENGVGPLGPAAQKTVNKVMAMFNERRLFCGHMIWPMTHPGEWHLFYFDQRDVAERGNHWDQGSHIHLINWVTHPRTDPNQLVRELFETVRPNLRGSLHIRYNRSRDDQR